MELQLFALTALLITVGAIVAAMAGFGFAVAIMPIMLMLYPVKVAIAMLLCVALGGGLFQWIRVRQHVHFPLVSRLVLGAFIGVPLGSYVLVVIDPIALKLLISFTILVATMVAFRKKEIVQMPVRMPRTDAVLVTGIGAGLLGASVGQAGPPVAFLMSWTRLDKAVVRATLVSFFITTNLLTIIMMAGNGILTAPVAWNAAALMPFYIVGILVGDKIFRRFSQAAFRKLVQVVLGTSALLGIANAVAGALV